MIVLLAVDIVSWVGLNYDPDDRASGGRYRDWNDAVPSGAARVPSG